jgi:NADH-quinone oxidoreductase subunit J
MFHLFAQNDAPPSRGLDVLFRENWRTIVPLALAFVGVYLLLPRVRRSQPLLGGALAGIGIALAGLWWIRPEAIWIDNLLFYSFAALATIGGLLMLSQRNPVHAALSFALVVLSTCGLFLLLAAPFLMAATLVVYAGAIVVTFLFVIMLAQQEGISSADHRSREPFFASLAGFVLLGTLIAVLNRGFDTRALDAPLGKLADLSKATTKQEVIDALGTPPAMPDDAATVISQVHKRFQEAKADSETIAMIDNLDLAWRGLDDAKNVTKAAELGKKLHDRGLELRQHGVVLTPTKGPASVVNPPRKMPAENVAAVGKVLFVDYLIPVEMAGVLLLVATIGAIAIAGRRSEELR